MAKKKGRKKASKKMAFFATAGAAIFGLKAYSGYTGKIEGGGGIKGLQWNTVGVNNAGKFVPAKAIENVTPLAVGIGLSILASKMGANRYLNIPMFKA